MNNLVIDIWIIPIQKEIMVTDFPGPPAAICGYVSEEAKNAAQERGCPTVSEIGFPSDLHLGPFHDWKTARETAEAKARELVGYTVRVEDSMFPDPDAGEDGGLWNEEDWWDDEYWDDDEYDD